MSIKEVTPLQARELLDQGATLIDIRDADEYAAEHIADARLVPLSSLNQGTVIGTHAQETIIFHCQSGNRTRNNEERLRLAAGPASACLLAGGITSWKSDGLPVERDKRHGLPLMRQVQMVAGALVLLGVALGYGVSGGFFLLSGFVGAGLFFAGISGYCGMARLLEKMPWNRP